MSDRTSAPSDSAALELVPPQPVAIVTAAQAATQAQNIDAAAAKQIEATVTAYVDAIVAADPHSPGFEQRLSSVRTLGDTDVRASAAVSNRLLERPAASMSSGALDPKSSISNNLAKLRRTVEDLDPTQQGVFGKKHRWGSLPFGNSVRDYFHKFESGQKNLDAIIQSLYAAQDQLQKDNASLEQEKTNIWSIKARLEQYIYMATTLDTQLSARIDSLRASDPGRAKDLEQDVLFPVRQKRQDLLTQLAVNIQGYLAIDLVKKNNLELIKGVDRAATTTVSALRTAVVVAQGLNNQKLVLDQIDALNTTTSILIESSSEMLKEQSAQVYDQAAGSAVQLESLHAAFRNIYASIDAIDGYKAQALDNMKKTIDALASEVNKAQAYLERAHAGPAPAEAAMNVLTVPAANKPGPG